jgi:hypothetical protein
MKINFNYLYEYGLSNQTKETYDAGTGVKIDLFSNVFDNTRTQNRGGAELIFENSKHYVSGGAFIRNINIDNYNVVSDTNINQNINNVLPKFKYEYKPSLSKRVTFNYNTSSQQPTVNDLAPVQDNTNPNRIQSGNPNLKPNYTHTAMINFNTWNALSGKYIWSGASMNFTNNAFVDSTNYDTYGRTISKTVNVDGNMNAVVYAGAGFPILNRKIEFQPGINGSFFRSKNFVGGDANTTDNFSLSPELDIDFEWDSLEISLKSSYSYNNPISSLSSVSNSPYSTEKYSIDVKWTLPFGFMIKTEGTFNRNTQIGGNGAFNRQFFIWNAEISKKFLPTQNLTVSLNGNDILNQNVSAARSVFGNQVTDNKTTIISRYFLLKMTYRFNNRKTKEDDFRGMH